MIPIIYKDKDNNEYLTAMRVQCKNYSNYITPSLLINAVESINPSYPFHNDTLLMHDYTAKVKNCGCYIRVVVSLEGFNSAAVNEVLIYNNNNAQYPVILHAPNLELFKTDLKSRLKPSNKSVRNIHSPSRTTERLNEVLRDYKFPTVSKSTSKNTQENITKFCRKRPNDDLQIPKKKKNYLKLHL